MLTLQNRMNEVFPKPQRRGLQSEIATLCEVKSASVSAWFNLPEKVSSISRTHAEKLCSHFDLKVAPAWLAEGVGEKYSASTPKTGVQVESNAGKVSLSSILADLAAYLERLDADDRTEAMKMMAVLADKPERHRKVAASIESMVAATFAQGRRKAA